MEDEAGEFEKKGKYEEIERVMNEKYRFIFLNQMAGPLFRELAEDLAMRWSPSVIYTGHPHTVCKAGNGCLRIKKGPAYNRTNLLSRFLSWLDYFVKALKEVWSQPKDAFLFFVSNPPFLGLIGLIVKSIRAQQYAVLVYDIYPDVLVGLGRLRKGFFTGCWDLFNRLIYANASLVITIGMDMADRLVKKYAILATENKLISIPSWADTKNIKPIAKNDNWFVEKYGLLEKTTVLYSGNMGHTHDIKSILDVAKSLSNEPNIHFLFIGEGAKWHFAERFIQMHSLQNVTLLPFQHEEILPFSMASGDIGIIAYQPGTEGCIIPSKTYYYLAAGLAPFLLSDRDNDLARMINENNCGRCVKNGDIDGLANAILDLHKNPMALMQYKTAARRTAEQHYSRKNTMLFERALIDRGLRC